jgi:transposase-like protein
VDQGYHILSKKASGELAKLLATNSQIILPMMELIEESRMAVDELIETLGRATVEAVLLISAAGAAGESHQGRKCGDVLRHGSQAGVVALSNRKMRVTKPRLRNRSKGKGREVEVPAYEAMQDDGRLGDKILSVMMRGISTRNYEAILPDACESIGVSKSSVSRRFIEASEEECNRLLERRFDETDILVIYIDGMVFAEHCVVGAVGVDRTGVKHVLGVVEGATENAVVVKALLESMVERGIRPDRKRLFVIDGAKALRAGIDAVYGEENPVQRCRKHKERNVEGYLPEDLGEYTRLTMKAAWKLSADEGMMRLKTLAESLSKQHPDAAASVLEGLEEMFTVNRLGLPRSLHRGLSTTNIIESSISGVKDRTHRVKRWQDGAMAKRWAASSLLSAEKNFRRIMGYRDLWMLDAVLTEGIDKSQKAA